MSAHGGNGWTPDPSDASSFYFLGAVTEGGFPQGCYHCGLADRTQCATSNLLTHGWNFITHCHFRGLLKSFQKSGCRFFKWIGEKFVRSGIFKMTTQTSLILILRLTEYQLVGKPSAEFLAFWFPLKQWLARLHSAH